MARFEVALAILVSASHVESFHNFQLHSIYQQRVNVLSRTAENETPRLIASSLSSPEFTDHGESVGEALTMVADAARDSIAKAVSDEPDVDEAEVALKQRLVRERAKTYTVTLPLSSSFSAEKGSILSIGMTLCQINKGREYDPIELDLDSLEFLKTDYIELQEGVQRMDATSLARRVDGEFQGLIVSSIVEGSAAWAAGIRAGDIVKATSATIGPQLWPKSSLEGVRSAVMSRKAVSGSAQFQFQRLGDAVDNQYELTLTRPIGLELKESEDGYVVVTGFTENAPTLVRYAVKVGDRVLAVDSSLGGRMWPVSTVEGVISAVTSRLPGQQITFRFERSALNMETEFGKEPAAMTKRKPEVVTTTPVGIGQEELLKRCRTIIKRYSVAEQTDEKFVNKYAVPGLVADKVLDALASAAAMVDAVTLSMIMKAYLSCGQSKKAIDAFEAVVGVSANGSTDLAKAVIKGKDDNQVTRNHKALDAFTVSSLLKAHAMNGDLSSVRRVLAAIEGRAGSLVDEKEVARWPGTGPEGVIRPDTRCYNIAISAAADSSAKDGIDLALQIFDSMSAPSSRNTDILQKTVVSYNTIINALTTRGRYEEAIELFYDMKRAGVKPDKYSYTSLVQAVLSIADGDIEELFYDMREQGVTPDVVTYNTVIKELCEQRRIVAAKKIVGMMEAMGVSPNSITYGLLMKALIKSGKPSAALTLFETACSDQRTVVHTENIYLYTTAISAAASIGDHERALELLSRMNALAITPNLKTMTAIVGACMAAGKPDLAYDVYIRIQNPDGYAMTQGLRALCECGRVEEALSLVTSKGSRALSGKQLMLLYTSMVESALSRYDYDSARNVVASLLRKGNIPSKTFYQAIFDSMNLFPKTVSSLTPVVHLNDEAKEKFKFLLFVLDSLHGRNLPCEGPLYAAILSYGARLGSLPRKLVSLLVSAKASGDVTGAKIIDDTSCKTECLLTTWEEVFERYDDLKEQISNNISVLPLTRVRVSKRDIPKILRAEKSLSYSKRRPRRQEV